MDILSFIKKLFKKLFGEESVNVSVDVNQTEKIENRLAEVAADKAVELKLTAKDIKAKMSKPVEKKVAPKKTTKPAPKKKTPPKK